MTVLAESGIPDRLRHVERRIEQLDCVDDILIRVDELEKNTWRDKSVLTMSEAAQYLAITERYLRKLISLKKIPHYCPVGKHVYFSKKELEQWVMSHPVCEERTIDDTIK